MGNSARYHAASLAAVFLALAVGILIGAEFGDDVVSGTRENLEQSLTGDLESARERADELAGQLDRSREFGERTDSEPSSITTFEDADLSSADNVDEVAGRVALVFALLGAEGSFGQKDTADQLLPDLLTPGPSLPPVTEPEPGGGRGAGARGRGGTVRG